MRQSERSAWFAGPKKDRQKICRQECNPRQRDGDGQKSSNANNVCRLKPPIPEIDEHGEPDHDAAKIFGALATGEQRNHQRLRAGTATSHGREACHACDPNPKKGAAVRMMVSRSEYSGKKPSTFRARSESA